MPLSHLLLALLLCCTGLLNLQSYPISEIQTESVIQGGRLCLILSALSESSMASVYTNRLQRTLNLVCFEAVSLE
jgi:hypothetical protein